MTKLKTINPLTPSQRHLVKVLEHPDEIEKQSKLKFKTLGKTNNSGRAKKGQITVRHKGGGHKKCFRILKTKNYKPSENVILSIEYDPNRTHYISAVYCFNNNKFFYVTTSANSKIGDIIKSGSSFEPKLGHSMPLFKIPVGSYVHNISIKKNQKSKVARAAGNYALVLEQDANNKVRLKLRSGNIIRVPLHCVATVGVVSNSLHFFKKKGKAGRSRWLNIRPTVRGVAMNPVDHPNGGGEGKKSGSKKSPWGKFN